MDSQKFFLAGSMIVAGILFPSAGLVLAQEDVTPPALLDFSISPVVFDTGIGDVTVTWCATAQDDLSGVRSINAQARYPGQGGNRSFGDADLDNRGDLLVHGCAEVILPQFSEYGTFRLDIQVTDNVGNEVHHSSLFSPNPPSILDLCETFTPCEIVNQQGTPSTDSDGDGIVDTSDNCPGDPNPNQEDSDLDLTGDVCDPFPNDRDNEQAQCEADLNQCILDFNQCLADGFDDDDGDGEINDTDKCPGSPNGAEVDDSGCSQEQFCQSLSSEGRRVCRKSDWKNDEPTRSSPRDCHFDRGPTRSSDDDTCTSA